MISTKSKVGVAFFVIMLAVGLLLGGRYFLLRTNTPPQTVVQEFRDVVSPPEVEVIQERSQDENSVQTETIPGKVLIDVPFTSQAPFGVWDERHEDACEEASVIMAHYYLEKKPLTKEEAEREIQKVIDYQIKKYGDFKDSDVQRTVEFAGSLYNMKNLKIVYDFEKNEIKKELAKGNPIIIPAAGRELGNPNFTQPGPLYHMLILVGYSSNQIIANDPGTRKGENYRYDIDVLFDAIHDFPGDKEKIKEGRKAMIVVVNGN